MKQEIRTALRAAETAAQEWTAGTLFASMWAREATAAGIAAFLRALPEWHRIDGYPVSSLYFVTLAEAVEAAAGRPR